MPYVPYADNVPIGLALVETVVDNTRENLMALRDNVVIGTMPGWAYSKTNGSGTDEQPQYTFMKKGSEWLRGTFTWGTTGGEDGNVVSVLWQYSNNAGVDYQTVGTQTFTYSVDGVATAVGWS
jgi:hypothetical protein